FPVALIAALYNGRLALLGTALALICADYFLQKPLYIFGNDNPLEYGDLFVFGLLAVTTIKFVRVLTRPRARSLAAKRPQSTWKLYRGFWSAAPALNPAPAHRWRRACASTPANRPSRGRNRDARTGARSFRRSPPGFRSGRRRSLPF